MTLDKRWTDESFVAGDLVFVCCWCFEVLVIVMVQPLHITTSKVGAPGCTYATTPARKPAAPAPD